MGWAAVAIGDVCEPTEQRDPRSDPAGKFHYVDIAGIDRNRKAIAEYQTMPGADAPSRARKVIRKNDVLVSTVRPNLNAVAMVPAHLDGQIASTGFCVLRPRPAAVEPRYLFYWTVTPSFVSALTALIRGASYPAVSDRDVKEAGIPLPPLAEQRRLVEILDQADRLRRLRAEADTKAERILSALFIKMFGDPATNPMGWPSKRIGDMCRVVSGATPKTNCPEFWGGGIPWATPKDISALDGWSLNHTPPHVDRRGSGKLLGYHDAREICSSLFQGTDWPSRGCGGADVHQSRIQELGLWSRHRALVSVRLVQTPHGLPSIAGPWGHIRGDIKADRRVYRDTVAGHADTTAISRGAGELEFNRPAAKPFHAARRRSSGRAVQQSVFRCPHHHMA